jgi:hypothetical protein
VLHQINNPDHNSIFSHYFLFPLSFSCDIRYFPISRNSIVNYPAIINMKFATSAAALSVAALAGTTLAAPMQGSAGLYPRNGRGFGPGNFTALNPRDVIFPQVTSQYNVGTGAVSLNTGSGVVDKYPSNGGKDITSLVTFSIPAYPSGFTCELVFDLDSTRGVSGSASAQAFTSLAPATATTSTWPQGNQRDQFVGTLKAIPGERATWDLPASTRQFPCSEAVGRLYGGELVPTGDSDHISWVPGVDGPKIVVY